MVQSSSRLSQRLRTILAQFQEGEPVWDFCCDHGYLGEAALLSGRFSEVHFVDQVPHIIEALKSRLQASAEDEGLTPSETACFFYTVAGESVVTEVRGNASITGVGASTIQEILRGLWEAELLKANVLVLGPHRDTHLMAAWLEGQRWPYRLDQILTVLERGRERKLFILKKQG